jgi:hypothetical protein
MEGSGKRGPQDNPRRVNILESTGGVNEKTRVLGSRMCPGLKAGQIWRAD